MIPYYYPITDTVLTLKIFVLKSEKGRPLGRLEALRHEMPSAGDGAIVLS